MINLQGSDYYMQYLNGREETAGRAGYLRKRYWSRPKKGLPIDNLPHVEAARTEMSLLPTKTPVSVLQELLSRRGSTPKYELVQIEGAIHEPTFRYRVTVADTIALGTGRSKKEAKHAAAKNVLEKLVGNAVSEEGSVALAPVNAGHNVNSYDKISGNPIGTLQEMCISRRWPPPTYEMTSEEGLPHERQFKITCTVFNYREVGSGKSKKLAKREAAYKMWEKLQETPLDPSQLNYGNEASYLQEHIQQDKIGQTSFQAILLRHLFLSFMKGNQWTLSFTDRQVDQEMTSPSSRYADLKFSKISTLTTPHSHKVTTFHRNLKHSQGEKLNELQVISLNETNFSYIQFLQEIAREQQFEVTYVDIEEKSMTGKYQCLLQLSTLPVAVCYGSGSKAEEAQSAAAHNALEYLKIMTKK